MIYVNVPACIIYNKETTSIAVLNVIPSHLPQPLVLVPLDQSQNDVGSMYVSSSIVDSKTRKDHKILDKFGFPLLDAYFYKYPYQTLRIDHTTEHQISDDFTLSFHIRPVAFSDGEILKIGRDAKNIKVFMKLGGEIKIRLVTV